MIGIHQHQPVAGSVHGSAAPSCKCFNNCVRATECAGLCQWVHLVGLPISSHISGVHSERSSGKMDCKGSECDLAGLHVDRLHTTEYLSAGADDLLTLQTAIAGQE